MWDFTWIGDPSAWIGLGTLVIIEIVLGIDNLVFISILAGKLPEEQKQRAFTLGLALALLMRLVLLSAIAWLVGLTKPLFSLFGHGFSARDLILLVGGVFLLFKATLELHERLEAVPHGGPETGRQAVFWQVVAQILVLDAVFSLDSVITSVGMVKELPVMMLAVVAAMLVMLLAARPLTAFVEKHPTVIVLCLGFLLMIGLSLIMEGCGLHVPKGYLYAAIAFSVLVELFNQLALRNRRLRVTPRNMRESTARAVLRLLGGRDGACRLDVEALAQGQQPEEVFTDEERSMVARVIRLGGRTARYVMTPRRNMVCLPVLASRAEVARAAEDWPHAWIPVCDAEGGVPGAVHPGQLLALGSKGDMDLSTVLRPLPSVLEHAPLTDVLEVFRDEFAPLVLVRDEYGDVAGCVAADDVLRVLTGLREKGMEAACATRATGGTGAAPDAVRDAVRDVPGSLRIDEAQEMLGLALPADSDAATLAGFILEQRGHIPAQGERWRWGQWVWEVLHMDGRRIHMVRLTPAEGTQEA